MDDVLYVGDPKWCHLNIVKASDCVVLSDITVMMFDRGRAHPDERSRETKEERGGTRLRLLQLLLRIESAHAPLCV